MSEQKLQARVYSRTAPTEEQLAQLRAKLGFFYFSGSSGRQTVHKKHVARLLI